MARYFFDVHDGRTFLDEEGSELESLSAVREEVHRSLVEMSAGLSQTKNAFQLRVDVRDAADARVMTATMLIVIEVPLEASKELSSLDTVPLFDESPGSLARRTRAGNGATHTTKDGSAATRPSINKGLE